MHKISKLIFLKFFIFSNIFISNIVFADNHNIEEILKIIQRDIKTLEKAVYSNANSESSNSDLNENSEDVLTRHLLKLSEVQEQFRQLTNKFEEINFKLDKLSNRLSKTQADNQIRFQDIETSIIAGNGKNNLTSISNNENNNKILPGSSQPQDLGSISYKDNEKNKNSQEIQSVDTTATIITENFESEEKILPKDQSPEEQYEFATSFLKIGDRSAGAIKSGGTTRRAAKMVVVDIDHPDIEEYINWKVKEEQKVAALVTGSKVVSKHLKAIMKACVNCEGNDDDCFDVAMNPALKREVRAAKKALVPAPGGECPKCYPGSGRPVGHRGRHSIHPPKNKWGATKKLQRKAGQKQTGNAASAGGAE